MTRPQCHLQSKGIFEWAMQIEATVADAHISRRHKHHLYAHPSLPTLISTHIPSTSPTLFSVHLIPILLTSQDMHIKTPGQDTLEVSSYGLSSSFADTPICNPKVK